jgi:Ferredoxin-like domain in Api92-like protein
MPNWCNNTVEINHKDPAKMYALVEAVNEGKFCNFAIPVPESLHIVAGRAGADDTPEQKALVEAEERNLEAHGYKNWWDFCTNEWGTKWDVDPYESVEYDDAHDKRGITFGFDSAWSPPTGVYEALMDQGYSVRAYYYEPGMAFCGIYDENGDDCYNIGDMTSETVKDAIPEALDEMFGISETIAEYEEEENENE